MPAIPVLEEHVDPVALTLSAAFGAKPLSIGLRLGKMGPTKGADFTGADLPDGQGSLADHGGSIAKQKRRYCGNSYAWTSSFAALLLGRRLWEIDVFLAFAATRLLG